MRLDSPWRISGRIRVSSQMSAEQLLDRIAEKVGARGTNDVRRTVNGVAFERPPWRLFLPGFSPTRVYNSGAAWLERDAAGTLIRWQLDFMFLFLFCLLTGLVFVGFAGSFEGPARGLVIGGFAFFWLYIPNLLIGVSSISSALQEVAGAGQPREDFTLADKIGCLSVIAAGFALLVWIWLF